MNRRDVILKNTTLNGAGRLWDAAISLALVAYIVPKIGLEHYGLWAIVGAFTGYAALFDVGLGSAYSRFIAEHAARGNDRRISEVVSTGVAFYAAFGLLFVGAMWAGVDLLVYLGMRFGGAAFSVADLEEFEFLLRWSVVLFAVSNCLAPFSAVQIGLQRMGVSNAISMTTAAVKLIATVYFLEQGLGLRGLIYANAVVLAAFAVLTILATLTIAPNLRTTFRYVSYETFMSLFRFGWRAQFARLANLVMFETDVLVIALLLRNLELAGLYKVGVELANKTRHFPGILVTAIIPAAADFHARGEADTVRKLYLRSTKYSAALAVPMAAFVAAAAYPLLKTWLGPISGLTTAAIVLQVMVIGYVANIVPGAGVSVALGMGRADLQMRAGLISMFANIALTVVLAWMIGFWGIPLATVVSMALSWAWFARAMGNVIDLDAGSMSRASLAWPAVTGLAVFTVTFLAAFPFEHVAGRAANGALVVALTLVAGMVVAACIRWTPLFDEYDRVVIRRAIEIPGEWAWTRRLRAG